MGIPRNAVVADLVVDGAWSLPPARSEQQVSLYSFISTITLSETNDQYVWLLERTKSSKTNTGAIHNEIRADTARVPWFKTVWNPWGIPKHSFLMWLFVLNRCPTRDRLINWGLPTAPNCLLCNALAESRDHLFFQCPFAWSVWLTVAAKCNLTPLPTWNQTMLALQSLRCARPQKILTLLACQATVYLLWTERNNRLHRQVFRSPDSIVSSVSTTIRTKIASMREASPALSYSMFAIWSA